MRRMLRQRHNKAMKVLDLQCAHLHTFEGWFASEDDFQDQLVRGLVSCRVDFVAAGLGGCDSAPR